MTANNHNYTGRADAEMIRNLRERVERQERQLRREFEARMNEDRARLQARVAGMSGDDIRNLSQREFQELFTELGEELGTSGTGQRGPVVGGGVRVPAGAGNIPPVVETVNNVDDVTMDGSEIG